MTTLPAIASLDFTADAIADATDIDRAAGMLNSRHGVTARVRKMIDAGWDVDFVGDVTDDEAGTRFNTTPNVWTPLTFDRMTQIRYFCVIAMSPDGREAKIIINIHRWMERRYGRDVRCGKIAKVTKTFIDDAPATPAAPVVDDAPLTFPTWLTPQVARDFDTLTNDVDDDDFGTMAATMQAAGHDLNAEDCEIITIKRGIACSEGAWIG